MSDQNAGGDQRPMGLTIPVAQDVAAGIFLMLVGGFFVYLGRDLPMGSLRAVGPGMLPRAVALMIVFGGAILVLMGLLDKKGPRLPTFSYRGPFFIILGILCFAFLIRTVGLVAAGPVAMIVASYASNETKIIETAIFSVIMTGLCVFLFKYMLNLPIPVIANYW
jgi:hypothetical protein